MDRDVLNRTKQIIQDITREAKVGDIYDAKVIRLEKFGAFVELWKGQDALLHVSKISNQRVEKPEDVLTIGDSIKVKVTEITDKGVSVSAKDLLPKNDSKDSEKHEEKKHFGEVRFFKKKD